MRPPRALTCCALAVLLFQTTGCYSWHVVDPQSLTPEQLEGIDRVKIVTDSGWRGRLDGPTISHDTLLAGTEWDGYPRSIPIQTIEQLSAGRMNKTQTGLAVGGAGLLVLSALGVGMVFLLFSELGLKTCP